jgi:hypothetical protein
VNARLAKLFRDSPRIRISDTRKKTLSRDAPLVVSAQVDPDGPWFPVSGLGDAHRRFIMKVISIELFLDNASGLKSKVAKRVWDQNPFLRPRFYDEGPAMNQLLQIPSPSFAFIDEPERGLHSSAEAYLAEGIGDLSDYVLATSHSLKILNFGLKRGCASLVERDEVGNFQIATSVPAMSSKLVGALEMNLGIEPADLVSLISAFVLVEGVHDARVLEHFLAAFLKQHRIEIIPMQGTKGVEDLVTSPFLFAATSAPIIVVLDNGRQEEVRKLLQEIRQVPDRETRKKIQNKYIKQFDTKEMKAILNLIGQAIEGDKLERVHPFAMSKRDIIDYIPIKNFSDKFESWAFFKPGDGRLRKTWLTSKGISCTEAGIRQALKKGAANEDPRHRDFVDLEELLLRVAR